MPVGVGRTRTVRKSFGSTAGHEFGEARVDASVNPLAQPEVARLDSLEEITQWLGTFRVRLQQARAADRDGIAAVVDRLEDHYRLRRAELS